MRHLPRLPGRRTCSRAGAATGLVPTLAGSLLCSSRGLPACRHTRSSVVRGVSSVSALRASASRSATLFAGSDMRRPSNPTTKTAAVPAASSNVCRSALSSSPSARSRRASSAESEPAGEGVPGGDGKGGRSRALHPAGTPSRSASAVHPRGPTTRSEPEALRSVLPIVITSLPEYRASRRAGRAPAPRHRAASLPRAH